MSMVIVVLVLSLGAQSDSASATACRAALSSTRELRLALAATRAWRAKLLTARGKPREASRQAPGGLVQTSHRVVRKQGVFSPCQGYVVANVPGRLGRGHGW
jgi:hypothetical protein